MEDRWTDALQEIKKDMESLHESVPHDNWYLRPGAGRWTALEQVDHLSKINESYFPIFSLVQSGKYKRPFIGNFGFLVQYLGRVLLQSVKPENPKKYKTLPIWDPDKSISVEDVFKKFGVQQDTLLNYIPNLLSYMDRQTVIHSPGSQVIVYKLETALDIILAHEQRHMLSIRQCIQA